MNSDDGNMGYMIYDKGFLLWIISSMYQSHESKVWACITSFIHIYIWYITWCLTAYLCACDDDTIFYSRFSLHIYQYTCSGPCTPLDIHYTTRWGVSDSPGSAYLDLGAWNLELEACGFSQLLIRDAQQKRGSSADRPELFPFSPLLDSRVFLL